jgi:hypothetical protein
MNGQVIVRISTLSNWSGILSNRKPKARIPKSQCELENAIDEALNDLSLNVILMHV